MKFPILFLIITILLSANCIAQDTQNTEQIPSKKREITIEKINEKPKIDGNLSESVWENAAIAKDFVMFRPGIGTPEPQNQRTEVKIMYDDEAIYIGAFLYDDHIENIPMQFSTRDDFAQADFFGVVLNPFNDGLNDTEFFVMSTGTQADAKVSSDGEDFSWSAVWDSRVKVQKDGWVVEMKIPFSVLRFSNKENNQWGLNFHRRIQSKKEQYTWNFIDKTKGNIMEYAGILNGIEQIDPPIRLSFYPYAQGSFSYFNKQHNWKGSAGMDVKYGINESFTLDATLIPDFGQTESDDIVLNLGPFEQEYEEKRAFFTEGTELFNKGDLIYSRRIGSSPINYGNAYNNLGINETVIENPDKTKLLNAVKISGRNKGGFGIGFFNAFTKTSHAIIKDTLTGVKRRVMTSPFTNYNALVFDKQFKNTSSITLVNSNVWRNGSTYDANVTSFLSNLRLLKSKYSFNTDLSISNKILSSDTHSGFQGSASFRKISGKHRFGFYSELSDTQYDKNDFGIQYYNNFVGFNANYNFRIFEPTEHFNSFNIYFNASYNQLFKPSAYTSNGLNLSINMTNKKELSFGGNINMSIGKQFDYYEPRVANRYFENKNIDNVNFWISSDYRKKFATNVYLGYGTQLNVEKPTAGPFFGIAPRFRFNDKFQMNYSFNLDITKNDRGYVKILDDETIIFGKRDYNSWTNELTGTYNFSTKSALNLSLRHYWVPLEYDDQYYQLLENGTLATHIYSGNHDVNFNAWNLDLSYQWEFAPGSQMIFLYRNALQEADNQANLNFIKNVSKFFENPFQHQLSLRLVYYIDYNNLKNIF